MLFHIISILRYKDFRHILQNVNLFQDSRNVKKHLNPFCFHLTLNFHYTEDSHLVPDFVLKEAGRQSKLIYANKYQNVYLHCQFLS